MDLSIRRTRSKGKERERARHGHQRHIQEEYALYRQDDYDFDDVDELAEQEERDMNRDRGVFVTPQPSPPRVREAKKEMAIAAARQAVNIPRTDPALDYTFSRAPLRSQNGQGNVPRGTPAPDDSEQRRRYMESERQYQYEQQQKAMRHREEEILRKRGEERRRKEEEGILRRQKEAEEAALIARSDSQGYDGSVGRVSNSTAQASTASRSSSTHSTTLQQPSASSLMIATSTLPSYQVPTSMTSFYAPALGSSSTSMTVPTSYQTPGSSLTTVMYTNSSRNPPPTSGVSVPSVETPRTEQASQVYPQVHRQAGSSQELPPQASLQAAQPQAPLQAPPQLPPQVGPQTTFQEPTRPPSYVEGPTMLPIEPTRQEGDSTDSESVYALNVRQEERRRMNTHFGERPELQSTPSRNKLRSPSPVTTTSPAPPEAGRSIFYPQLMSQHQKKQGYYPSSNSMFAVPGGPHFVYPGDPRQQPYSAGISGGLFNSVSEVLHNQQKRQSSPAIYPYRTTQQQASPASSSSSNSHPRVNYPGLSQSVTLVPLPTPPIYSSASAPTGQSVHGLMPPQPPLSRSASHQPTHTKKGRILKTVTLPKECLPRFLGIAKVNTAVNKETCGLLLGKDKGSKYVVTTLLIPKQYSTSDTCTMDEEELVLQFTEERSLITLGWIHTHPSQSCFMSSLDLHTHSGFQRMLPESFAVVCAPKSTPNYGIFRLTDPPGLKTILDCKEKEAFHPHPDFPIYTDADKGHVQIREGAPLEIVDLR
ncbi:hypothetical protein AX15_000612 [Amanita polypyramis BW_CC]|nr:hypothetical protein AX15_000612 [Amanita polypyramis BW_CC]